MDGKLNINFEDGRDKVFSADGIFRLISDPELQIAAHRVNDFVIREKDIVKNLAHLIRESVKRYN